MFHRMCSLPDMSQHRGKNDHVGVGTQSLQSQSRDKIQDYIVVITNL